MRDVDIIASPYCVVWCCVVCTERSRAISRAISRASRNPSAAVPQLPAVRQCQCHRISFSCLCLTLTNCRMVAMARSCRRVPRRRPRRWAAAGPRGRPARLTTLPTRAVTFACCLLLVDVFFSIVRCWSVRAEGQRVRPLHQRRAGRAHQLYSPCHLML